MAVEHLKSTAVTNATATPLVLSDAILEGGGLREAVGVTQASASASIGSTYRLVRVPSNARVSQVLLSCDAFDTTGAGDVGLYDVDGGDAVDADFFASAQSLIVALSNSDVTHESGVFGIEDSEKPLWKALGLSEDPHKDYDVAITLTAANGAGATPDVALKVRYVV